MYGCFSGGMLSRRTLPEFRSWSQTMQVQPMNSSLPPKNVPHMPFLTGPCSVLARTRMPMTSVAWVYLPYSSSLAKSLRDLKAAAPTGRAEGSFVGGGFPGRSVDVCADKHTIRAKAKPWRGWNMDAPGSWLSHSTQPRTEMQM